MLSPSLPLLLFCLTRYPNYYDDLQAQADAARKKAVDLAKAAESGKKAKKAKDDDEGGGDGGGGEVEQETFVDTAAPHPSYVLSPPTARISSVCTILVSARGVCMCARVLAVQFMCLIFSLELPKFMGIALPPSSASFGGMR